MVEPATAQLSLRSRHILYAAVSEYIATGEPVGSQRLAKRYRIKLSPATIRSVLADLEEAGYLVQPHPSAGRVPTDAGFRLFVDGLIHMRELPLEERRAVLERLRDTKGNHHALMHEVGSVLSALTGTAAIVVAPRLETERLSQVRFMPLREGQYLAVLVTRSGDVQNRIVPFVELMSADELQELHNYLDSMVSDCSLIELRKRLALEVSHERGDYERLKRRTKHLFDAMMGDVVSETQVIIEGQGLLFDRPEFANVDKIRSYMHTFESKEKLLELLDQTLVAGGVQVLIGSEAKLSGIEDVSVVSAHYQSAGSTPGTLGIIGPTRIDYAKVMPIVGFTAQTIGAMLADDAESESST